MLNPYKVLGVPQGASIDICKKKARLLLKQYHPDNNGDEEMFHVVQQALKQIESGQYNTSNIIRKRHLTHKSLFSFQVVE